VDSVCRQGSVFAGEWFWFGLKCGSTK